MDLDPRDQKRKEGDRDARGSNEEFAEIDDDDCQVLQTVPRDSAVDVGENPKPLQLDDIMRVLKQSMSENQTNFGTLRRDVRRMESEAHEAKEMAAKATTLARDTQGALEALEARVAKIKAGKGPAPPSASTPMHNPSAGSKDWDQLGGEKGDTIVIGGFRPYAARDERQSEWDAVRGKLSPEMREAIVDTIVPSALCQTVLVKIKASATTRETRLEMLAWCRKFKEAAPTHQAAG